MTDNVPEFCDESLSSWLKRIRCRLYEIPTYHPVFNGLAEQMAQAVKMELKVFDHARDDLDSYLP